MVVLIYSNIHVYCFHNITMVKRKSNIQIQLTMETIQQKENRSLMHPKCYWSNEHSAVHNIKTNKEMSLLKSRRPAVNCIIQHHKYSCSLTIKQLSQQFSSVSICGEKMLLPTFFLDKNQTLTVSSSIHPVTWGCFPSPSELSRPGPSPSWLGCVSSAWLPWFAEIPPWPHCQTPGLSASAPACASPLSPTCEAAANTKVSVNSWSWIRLYIWCTVYLMVNISIVGLCPHRSSSCLRALLWALRALSSACLFCSSAKTSSSESPPGPGRSSESSSPWATSSSLIRASNERVWGTLERGKKRPKIWDVWHRVK